MAVDCQMRLPGLHVNCTGPRLHNPFGFYPDFTDTQIGA